MEQHYDSLDKMLELGMSMAVAQQMMKTMNSCISSVNVPTVGVQAPGMPQTAAPEYYFQIGDNVAGPFDDKETAGLIRSGKVSASSLVWRRGMSGWEPAQCLPEVNKLLVLNGK